MSESLKIDQLVELLEQYTDVYDHSPTGARGWVRGRREIKDFEPEVFIEWDKTHWRYHGESDGWTFEHHFRLVESSEPLDTLLRGDPILNSSEPCSHCNEVHPVSPSPRHEEFLNTLLDAQETALTADGYLIITLTPKNEQGLTIYEPDMFMGSLTDTAKKLVEAQLVYTAAQLYSSNILQQIQEVEDEPRQ